jgi:hypothetical protein
MHKNIKLNIPNNMSTYNSNLFTKMLKNLDYFGVQLNFQYKDQQKYRSIFGGVVFILFFGFSLTYMLINFQNFIDRKIMNLVYNEGFKEYAPEINFDNYTIKFAVGLDVGDPTLLPNLYKYLQIEFVSIATEKTNGVLKKTKTPIPLQPCNYSHFYNSFNSTFDSLGLSSLFCPDLRNVSVKGIYTDDEFNYFVFTVSLKKQWHDNTQEARKFFTDYEIKSIIYYIDTSISVWDYAKPIQNYLNNKFLTVDWQFFKKLNMDFMTLGFSSDDNILFRDEQSKDLAVIDTYEQYFDHISEDRMITKQRDYNSFSKIFIRSSTKNKVIKRVYMKITEYLANMSSILSSVLLIFYVIVSHLNNFKAKQSIIKKILNYKENISLKNKDAMIHLKNKFNSSKDQIVSGTQEKSNIFTNFSNLNNEGIIKIPTEINEKKMTNNYLITANNNLDGSNQFFNKEDNKNNSINPVILPAEDKLIRHKNSNKLNEPRFKRLSTFKIDSQKIQKENSKSLNFLKSLKMHFNIIEIINRSLCRCCLNKNQKLKNELYSYGFKKYNYHMSITSYLKKMHEIDLIKYLLLSEKQVDLFNFVSKPSVSLIGTNQLTESLIDKFNLRFNKDDIDKVFISFNELLDINSKSDFDNKLLRIVASEVDHLTI